MTDTSVADNANTSATEAALNSPPPAPAFYESFADQGLKDWATKAAFKSPEDVAKIAHKFDALKDVDPAQLMQIPADAKPEAVMAVLERLGAPKEAEAYGLTKIEGADKPTAEWAQGVFKEAGLLPWQAQLIASKQMEFMAQGQANVVAEEGAAAAREIAQLESPQGWGKDFNANRESARRAFNYASQKAGMSKDEASQALAYLESGMGVGGVMKFLNVFGGFIKEGSFVDGERGAEPEKKFGSWYKPIE